MAKEKNNNNKKNLIIPNMNRTLYIAGRDVRLSSYSAGQCGSFMYDWQLSCPTVQLVPFDLYHPREMKPSPPRLAHKHCSVISNSPKLELNHVPIARWLGKHTVICVMCVLQGCHSATKGVSK